MAISVIHRRLAPSVVAVTSEVVVDDRFAAALGWLLEQATGASTAATARTSRAVRGRTGAVHRSPAPETAGTIDPVTALDPDPTVRVRFAPAPTGYLHIGGARTALFNWLFARQHGGELVLRVEDTDAERSRPELVDAIYDTLGWLGLDWDGDPVHQSDRGDLYRAAADQLLASGAAYRCDCTRADVDARNLANGRKTPGYDGFCRDRDVADGPDVVVRFRIPDAGAAITFHDLIRGDVSFENANLEDFVIVRSGGVPMFLLANAVDDADLGITHIIRGEDLINTTPKVLLLRAALGYDYSPQYAHVPLIVNEKRQKLSKRRDDVSVGDYRDRGYLSEALVNYLVTLGWGAPDGIEIRPLAEIVELFRIADVSQSSAFFDLKKLDHFDGEYIRGLARDDFIARSGQWMAHHPVPWAPDDFDAGRVRRPGPARAGAGGAPRPGARLRRLPVPARSRGRRGVVGQGDGQVRRLRQAHARRRDRGLRDLRVDLRDGDGRHPGPGRAARAPEEAVAGARAGGGDRSIGRTPARRVARRARTRADARPPARGSPSPVAMSLVRLPFRIIGAVLAVLVLYLAFTFVQVWWASRQHSDASASAIVVMGAAQWNGRPSPDLKARLDHAAALFRAGRAHEIIVTGGKQKGDRVTQGVTGYDYLTATGIPAADVKLENQGTNSYTELSAAANIMRTQHLRPDVLLVSDPYHSLRISQIAGELGLTPHVSPDDVSSSLYSLSRETAAVSLGRIIGYRRLSELA